MIAQLFRFKSMTDERLESFHNECKFAFLMASLSACLPVIVGLILFFADKERIAGTVVLAIGLSIAAAPVRAMWIASKELDRRFEVRAMDDLAKEYGL